MTYEHSEDHVRRVVARSNFIIADNSGYLRGLMRFALEAYGAGGILEARDGAQIVDFLRLTHADALITAWRMWPIDGPTTICYLRGAPTSPNRQLPIIVLGNSDDLQGGVVAKVLGVNEFLTWPQSAHSLCTKVVAAMRQAAVAASPVALPAPSSSRTRSNLPHLTFEELRFLLAADGSELDDDL